MAFVAAAGIFGIILLLIGWLGRKFSRALPRASRWIGLSLFCLGVAAGVYCAGLAIYLIYEGAPISIIEIPVGAGALYLGIGVFLRWVLVPKAPSFNN